MEEQFIHVPVRAEMELHPEPLKLVDDEGSALVGTEFVGWLAPNRQRELSIAVLPDNNSRDTTADERAGAVLTEGRIRAIAGWNAGEDDVFDERLERSRYWQCFLHGWWKMRWRAGRSPRLRGR